MQLLDGLTFLYLTASKSKHLPIVPTLQEQQQPRSLDHFWAASATVDGDAVDNSLFRFVLTEDGQLTQNDAAYSRYTGEFGLPAQGTKLFSAIDRRDRASVITEWLLVTDTCMTFKADFRLVGVDASSRWFRMICQRFTSFDGRPQGWSGTLIDIDDLKQRHTPPQQAEARRRPKNDVHGSAPLSSSKELRNFQSGLPDHPAAPKPLTALAKLGLLTPRQGEVLRRLVAGDTSKEIARSSSGSPRTVEIHRARILEKLGARNVAEAVRVATSVGW